MKQMHVSYRISRSATPGEVAEKLSQAGKVVCGRAVNVTEKYYDTFDWRLFALNQSLAARSDPGGKMIRWFDHDSGREIGQIGGDILSGVVADLPPCRLTNRLKEIIGVRRLLPRLVLKSRRHPISIRDKEDKTVMRLQLEHFTAQKPKGSKSVSLGTRLTLQPIQGYEKVFTTVQGVIESALDVSTAGPAFHIEGLKALGETPGEYSSKLRLKLKPHMTAAEAAHAIHLELLNTMELNEDGICRNIDSEFLHDFRVAVRRTRSALGQIDKDILPSRVIGKAKKDFKWLGQVTGLLRDLDVYLIEFPEMQKLLPESYKSNLRPFHDYLVRRHARERKKLAAIIKGQRFKRIKDGWRSYLTNFKPGPENGKNAANPIKELADGRIWKTYRKLMKEGAAIDEDSPAEALHDLRKTCKKLRYLMEFFQSLYLGLEIDALIKALKKFQNVLGEFQDTEVQSLAILQFGREMSEAGAAPIETQMAMGMVAESILHRQGRAREDFHNRFTEFSCRSIRKKFARLFKR